MSMRVTGVDAVLEGFRTAVARLRAAFLAAQYTVSADIADDAVANAPKKTGQLRESVFLTRTEPVRIGFGARHAAITHETGPRKKFLQRAMSDASSRSRARLAALTMQYAQGGTTLSSVPGRHPATAPSSWPAPLSSGRRRPGVARRRRP